MAEESPQIPLPAIDSDSKPYWEGLRAHQLRLPRCNECARVVFFPRGHCPYCGSVALTWERMIGEGVVYSYTITRRAPGPAFANRVPYVVGLIDLAEGARMLSTIEAEPPDLVKIGSRVHVTFDDINDEVTLPRFRLQTPSEPSNAR